MVHEQGGERNNLVASVHEIRNNGTVLITYSPWSIHTRKRRLCISCPYVPTSRPLHNPQRPKPLQHVFVHSRKPLLLKHLLPAYGLYDCLHMLPDKRNEIDTMHRIRVDEFTLAQILRGLGFGWVVRLWRPEEGARDRSVSVRW